MARLKPSQKLELKMRTWGSDALLPSMLAECSSSRALKSLAQSSRRAYGAVNVVVELHKSLEDVGYKNVFWEPGEKKSATTG